MNKKKAKERVQPSADNAKVVAELIDLVQNQAQLDYILYKSPQALEEKVTLFSAKEKQYEQRLNSLNYEVAILRKMILDMHKATLEQLQGGCC